MPTLVGKSRSPWLKLMWAASLIPTVSCSEQHEPRASPIVARRLGGDSIAPGVLARVCTAEDEGCVPTFAVPCFVTWMGDSAQKPDIPPPSPEVQAWCEAQSAVDTAGR
jgi:hypothetical protein